jgi:NADPH-dependent 2,4-dienoyl-CoA reductase/sulfur reductase-like enzyme
MTTTDLIPMRAVYADNVGTAEKIHFEFEGRALTALAGDSIAAALISYGIVSLRETQAGTARGIFCGMGICQDCLVEIDGNTNQRACMVQAKQGMRISRQRFPGAPNQERTDNREDCSGAIEAETPDIVVIGGGVGGMSAACMAAETGLDVILLDERARPGGQFSKQPTPTHADSSMARNDKQIRLGQKLMERMTRAGINVISNAQVWAGFPERDILTLVDGRTRLFRPQRLVIATGAYERALPIEGWTLPGVITTGAAQSLLRTYHVIAGKRIFVAGNGPFNIQVALELAHAGATIVGIAESASRPGIRSIKALFDMYRGARNLLFDGIQYISQLKKNNIPMFYNYSLSSINEIENGLEATISLPSSSKFLKRKEISIEADIVCMGYGFLPSNVLLRNLGCEHHYDTFRRQLIVDRSENFETTNSGIYAVGDCAGLGGAYAACDEGTIAGLHAATSLGRKANDKHLTEVSRSRLELHRHRRFQSGLWQLYSAQLPKTVEAKPETHICRCELVTMEQICDVIESGCNSISEIKQQTRAGMGRCQGRYCASLLVEILTSGSSDPIDEENFFAPRVPISPIRIGDITQF